MNARPGSAQYQGDGLYGFLAASGVAKAFVEWQPTRGVFVLSDAETRAPIGLVVPSEFDQRVIGMFLR